LLINATTLSAHRFSKFKFNTHEQVSDSCGDEMSFKPEEIQMVITMNLLMFTPCSHLNFLFLTNLIIRSAEQFCYIQKIYQKQRQSAVWRATDMYSGITVAVKVQL
jgi:hypothetical protein